MTKKITAAAVPSLRLTEQDEFELRQLSAQLQREVVTMYEDFLFRGRRQLDDAQWKYVKSDGDVHVYRERKPSMRGSGDPTDPHASAYATPSAALAKPLHCKPHAALAAKSSLARVLATGTLPGTLDDLMYGSSYQDTASLQAFWATMGDQIEESAVVATIETAMLDDPYRFLGVTWLLRTFPMSAKLIRRRDCLTLGDTHLSKLSNGERIGVVVGHSVQHRDFAEMREFDTIRATTSVLKVYRQLDAHRVEVFIVRFLDTKGSAPASFHLNEAMRYTLPVARTSCAAGFRKKLLWLLRRRERERTSSSHCDVIEPTSSGSNEACEVCHKAIGKLFTCPGTACQLCYKRVCSRCSVSQDLPSPAKTAAKRVDFCIQCILEAKALSTLEVAEEQLLCRDDSGAKTRRRVLTTLLSATDSES